MLFIFSFHLFSVTIHKDKGAQSNFTMVKPHLRQRTSALRHVARKPPAQKKKTFLKGIPPSLKCIDGNKKKEYQDHNKQIDSN